MRAACSARPDGEPARPGLDLTTALALLRPVLEDAGLRKVGHDLKFDAIVLARHGVTLRGARDRHDDRQLSARLDALGASARGAGARAHRLQGAARGRRLRPRREGALRSPRCRSPPRWTSPANAPTSRCSSSGTLRALLTKESLDTRLRHARAPAHPGAAWPSSGPASASMSTTLRAQATRSTSELDRLAPAASTSSRARSSTSTRPRSCRRSCSTSSGSSTETIRRTTKTKAQSTSFEVLEELALHHELPRLMLEWRGLQKLKGTYIDALPQLVHPETGRVHTCFNQAVAATGRLSSSDPNLQNIPIRTEVGRNIRRAFVAEPGHVLISADYSQIELRVLAHLSGEQVAGRGLRARRGHPRSHRGEGLRYGPSGAQRARAAAARQDHQLRAALRQAGLHAGQGHRRVAPGSAGRSSTPTSPASLPCASFIDRTLEEARQSRRREDDVRAPAAGARVCQPQRPDPRLPPSAWRSTCRSRAPRPTSSRAR